jgi:hypothetical protein
MRLYSTPQSALAGEVTILAIVETLVATAFSIWLVVHRGTLTHVVVATCIAPLSLLRTKDSTALTYYYARRMDAFWGRFPFTRFPLVDFFFIVISLPVMPLLLRPIPIAITAIRRPLHSIRSIPQNWSRIVLATDLHHPPELLPESETTPPLDTLGLYQFSNIINITDVPREVRTLMFITAILVFLPGFVYRYALKSTAIVYLPILWILHDSLVDTAVFKHKLEDIADSPLEKLKRWYSGFVIVFLLVIPPMIYLTVNQWWQGLSNWLRHANPAVVAFLSAFLPSTPSGLHLEAWHVARAFNAILTLVLFQWAYSKLRQIERGRLLKPDTSVAVLNVWLLIRGLLTLYIIGCTLYILIVAVNWKSMWPFHVRWVP